MKKIININLSGRVIPIEDSAYEKLQAYIESLRRYFNNEEGRDEIINDIESRIAELLFEKVRLGSSAIIDSDIDAIIASMGRPEDFDSETISEAPGQQKQTQSDNYQYSEKKPRGRLYRDGGDKILGGVCSGLANYLNLDPAIVRILFAIVTIGGFGIGVLLYILLWIVLPSRELEGYSGKRLYRNPDDRILGGVAGGLAAYFNIRPSVMRLIFGLPLVISIFIRIVSGIAWNHHYGFGPNIVFGSISGTFILAYIILWMVLPEAKTQYEKMEMRGETVDVNTIRQNVKEGMENMKSKAKVWGQEVKQSAQELGGKAKEFARTRGKAFAAETGEAVRRSRSGFGHVIGVLFKVFFLIVFGSIAFGLFIAFIALLFGGIAWWPINHFLWTSNWQQLEAWGTLIFFIGVPLIGFIVWVIRRIIRVRSRSGYLGWTFGGLWVIGWVAAAMFAASITKDFRYYNHSDSAININQPSKGKLIVKVSQPELEYSGSFGWMSDSRGIDVSEDTMKLSLIKFTYTKSDDSFYHVTLKKFSAGSTRQNAIDRAEKIQYFLTSMDSVLDVGSSFAFDKTSKFRGQRIEIEITIPVGKKIRLDPSVSSKLNPDRFHVYHHRRWNGKGVEITIENDDYSPWRSSIDYVMGADGKLKGPDGAIVGDNYRYEEDDSIQIKQSIEQKKQELKELEDRQKNIKSKPTTLIQKKEDKDGPTVAFSPSPVFSLMNQFN